MTQHEIEAYPDSGFKSRKFILALVAILLIACLAIAFGFFGWEVGIFSTSATSLTTIVLGYSGISVAKSTVFRYSQRDKRGEGVGRLEPKQRGIGATEEREPQEEGV